tara:strand:- start:158 stop:373 length:216 start_codon:yes stop_codon:yes gene_type:complete
MNNRQIKLYNSMTKNEQKMFDHLVIVKNRKPDDVFFFLHTTYYPSRKPSFANLSTEQVIRTCQQLQLKDAA